MVAVPDPERTHSPGEPLEDGLCIASTPRIDCVRSEMFDGKGLTDCQSRVLDEVPPEPPSSPRLSSLAISTSNQR